MTEILAFTTEQAAHLTGLTMRQLSYWDKTGFFSPGYDKRGRGAYTRLYTFRDIVGLRTIALLRDKVPLQELRRVGKWLSEHYDTPWASLTFYVHKRRVFFLDTQTGFGMPGTGRGQIAQPFALEPIAHEVKKSASRLQRRDKSQIGQIHRHRHIAHNAPVLEGTRITTTAIWNFHEAGYSITAILKEYPRLTAKDVRAAITFERERRAAGERTG